MFVLCWLSPCLSSLVFWAYQGPELEYFRLESKELNVYMVKLSTYNWLMIRIILDAICPSVVNTELWYEKARSRKSNVAN